MIIGFACSRFQVFTKRTSCLAAFDWRNPTPRRPLICFSANSYCPRTTMGKRTPKASKTSKTARPSTRTQPVTKTRPTKTPAQIHKLVEDALKGNPRGVRLVPDNMEANWKTMAHYTGFVDTLSLKTWMTESNVAKDILEPFMVSYRAFFGGTSRTPTRNARIFEMAYSVGRQTRIFPTRTIPARSHGVLLFSGHA